MPLNFKKKHIPTLDMCDEYHESICFSNTISCPLCEALADMGSLDEQIKEKDDKIKDLEEEIGELKSEIAVLSSRPIHESLEMMKGEQKHKLYKEAQLL